MTVDLWLMREMFNASLFVLNFALMNIILFFLFNTWVSNGPGWSRLPGVQTACILLWVFLVDGARAGLFWIGLFYDRVAFPRPAPLVYSGALFALIAATGIAATLRAIYVFTPKEWGHWYWLASLSGALAFVALTRLIF